MSCIVCSINSKGRPGAVPFYFINAGAQTQFRFRVFSLLPFNKSTIDTIDGIYRSVIPFFFKEKQELICYHSGKMSGIALFQCINNITGKFPQQLVSGCISIFTVKVFEIFKICIN